MSTATLQPTATLMRRHKAAMKVVRSLGPTERVMLLLYVLRGSDRVDDALDAAEEAERDE